MLAGNIGQNPEARTTQGGTQITNFSLATSRPRLSEGRVMRDDNGYRVMDTEWHRITCFNGLGKTVADHCEKGMKALVHGRIHYRKWINSYNLQCEVNVGWVRMFRRWVALPLWLAHRRRRSHVSDRECPIFCVTALWSMLPERSKDDDDFQGTAGRTIEGLRAA